MSREWASKYVTHPFLRGKITHLRKAQGQAIGFATQTQPVHGKAGGLIPSIINNNMATGHSHLNAAQVYTQSPKSGVTAVQWCSGTWKEHPRIRIKSHTEAQNRSKEQKVGLI